MKKSAAILISVALVSLPLQGPARAQTCQECKPQRAGVVDFQGTQHVCFTGDDPNGTPAQRANSFNSSERNVIKAGVQEYWNTALAKVPNANVSFQFRDGYNDCQEGDIRIKRINGDRAVTQATDREVGFPGLTNSGWLSLQDNQWKWQAAHEFGHILDYKDAYGPAGLPPGCQDKTIMGDSQVWGALKCGDGEALAQRYGAQEETEEDYPSGGGECYMRTLVTRYYCYNGSTWYQCGEPDYYPMYSWCY